MEERFHVAIGLCRLLGLLHIVAHLRKHLEVSVDKLLSLCTLDVEPIGQTKHRYAVDDAEVGAFSLRSFIACNLRNRLIVNLCGRCRMDIVAFAEGIEHVGILTKMSHNAQFNLTIICREELAALFGNETLAYFLAIFAANGDVLQVRVARRKSTSGRNSLVKRRVDVARAWVYQFGQCIYVCAEQLFQRAII